MAETLVELKYTGPEPELTIMCMGGRSPVKVERNGTCKVPEADAKCLLARGDKVFEAVKAKGA